MIGSRGFWVTLLAVMVGACAIVVLLAHSNPQVVTPDRSESRTIAREVRYLRLLTRSASIPSPGEIPGLIRKSASRYDLAVKKPGTPGQVAEAWKMARPIALQIAATRRLPPGAALTVTTFARHKREIKGATIHDRLDLDITLEAQHGWTLPLKELG